MVSRPPPSGFHASASPCNSAVVDVCLDDVTLGPRALQALRSDAQGAANVDGRPLTEGFASLEKGAMALLQALHEAYSASRFQTKVAQLRVEAAGNEVKFLQLLGPAASMVQAPVFSRFGLPTGPKGVIVMKAFVKHVSSQSPRISKLAGDLRELLSLEREEQDLTPQLKGANEAMVNMTKRIRHAPVDVRGPLAMALHLPYHASAEEIAAEVPNLSTYARELAEEQLAKGRDAVVGVGKALGPALTTASDSELREAAYGVFERYLQKMLARVVTPLESFTSPPEEWRCAWADGIVRARHVRELWGDNDACQDECATSPRVVAELRVLDVGFTIIDDAMDGDLLRRAHAELEEHEAVGDLSESKDSCNIGARSVWLHFESPEERARMRPALLEVCMCLAGLPCALMAVSNSCDAMPQAKAVTRLNAPKLRLHPHVMAATYRPGAEYHAHLDSYGGTDNQRMLTIILYLNDDWRPGDGGELRVHRSTSQNGSRSEIDVDRFVDVEPLSGRVVVWRSREVYHAVREPKKQRWAMTLWVMAE